MMGARRVPSMPILTYYLKTGVTLRAESTEDFARLRDRVEGYLDCGESFVEERVEETRHDGRRARVAYVIPAEAVSVVKIEERLDREPVDSTVQHVEVL